MNPDTMTSDADFERALLSHVDLCYSVALALSHDPNGAVALVKETLQWAWQCNEGARNADTMKMALLRELRTRYLRRGKAAHIGSAGGRRQLQEVDA